MRYAELPQHWQRIFALEWLSVCKGSKAIAAVITDENGNIISEGRNMTCERTVPNPAAAHAETEAIRNLDTSRFPDKHAYTRRKIFFSIPLDTIYYVSYSIVRWEVFQWMYN